MLKVAIIVRSTFYSARGGDTVQVLETAAQLQHHNVKADVLLTSERVEYSAYDLLHFFNITRPADIIYHIRKSRKPFVVSPIFIDYSEYDKYHRRGLGGYLFRFLRPDFIEYLKTLGRWLTRKDKLMTGSFLWKGQRKSIQFILRHAAMLLPNSMSEQARLVAEYGISTAYTVIPNGINTTLFPVVHSSEKDAALVLCVARVEGIKNQLNLVKAFNNTPFRLLIIGNAAPNQSAYLRACRRIAASNVSFVDHLPQGKLVHYYRSAKVHVLPSWFETTGLSSLEAAAMGCNVVVTDKGDTREYFGNAAYYCDPGSVESIYASVRKAAMQPNNSNFEKKVRNEFCWERASVKTAAAYKKIKLACH